MRVLAVEFVQEGHEILQAAPQTIYRPRRDHVELTADNPLAEFIECWPTLSTFRAADPLIDKPLDNLPTLL